MSDRKYRQHGYQDREDRPQQAKSGPRPKDSMGGPRPMQMPGTREVARCFNCGVVLQALAEPLGNCPKCQAALHSCKMCTHFDTSRQNECRQPVTQRVARKDAENQCQLFQLTLRFERETSTGAPAATSTPNPGSSGSTGGSRADDARKAFENLLKK
jgi:hypothetical protein